MFERGEGPSPVVRSRGVCKTYPGGREALRGIDLDVSAGEVMALIGPSGSGKSTFLRCINHLETISSGGLMVLDEYMGYRRVGDKLIECSNRQVAARRSRIGMVFQNFNLFANMTALANVTLAPRIVNKADRKQAESRAEDLLARVGLEGSAHMYPRQLSGGQQQRVAIARALAMDPALLLFDEPTSALDPELVNDVLQVIAGLAAEGRTMVMVTHEIAFARRIADRVAFFEAGRVVEVGAVEQVIDNPQHERTARFLSTVL